METDQKYLSERTLSALVRRHWAECLMASLFILTGIIVERLGRTIELELQSFGLAVAARYSEIRLLEGGDIGLSYRLMSSRPLAFGNTEIIEGNWILGRGLSFGVRQKGRIIRGLWAEELAHNLDLLD